MLHWSSLVASHSAVANLRSMGAAGWSRAGPQGTTRPTNSVWYLLWLVERSCVCGALGLGSLEEVQCVLVGDGRISWHLVGRAGASGAGWQSGVDFGGHCALALYSW